MRFTHSHPKVLKEVAMRVAYVVLYVTNAPACLDFWVNKVGMVQKSSKQAGGFDIVQVGFANQQFGFELVPLALMKDNPDGLDLATPSIAFNVDDLAATREKLTAAGISASEIAEHSGVTAFAFSDNEGRWFAVTRA
jgi:lactoylglutathione lyase